MKSQDSSLQNPSDTIAKLKAENKALREELTQLGSVYQKTIERLAYSESMLQESQEAAGIGSFVVDTQTNIVQCTPILNRIFGLPEKEQFIHLDVFFDKMNPEDREPQRQLIAKAIEQGSTYTSEYRITVADTGKWVWEKGEIRRDEPENKIRVIGVIQDITKQKIYQQKLEELQSLLEQSQAIAHIGSFDMDAQNHAVFATPETYRILGIEGMVGDTNPYQLFIDSTHPEDRSWVDAAVRKAIETDRLYSVEHRIVQPSGRERWIWSTGKLIHNRVGDKSRLIGVIIDVTERRMLAELENVNKRLTARNDELDTFVYTASHDLRSPVNNIEMLINYLVKEMKGKS